MSCDKKVTVGLLFNCLDAPKKGIVGGKGVLINWDDIDRTASTTNGSIITDLVTKSGTTGIAGEWYKDLASATGTFAPSAEDIDGFIHAFLSRLGNTSAGSADRANEMKGSRFVMVYETKYKGTNDVEALKVAGWDNGLRLSEMVFDTAANSGAGLFTLATEEGDVEQYPYNVFLEVDAATSKATFDSLFATV